MVKKFTIPFASQGDANDIPDALQVDGKVSFTQGFGYDYERPYDDPQAKDIAREDMNGLFKAITSAVGELQTLGASEWSSAISYPKGAIVYFEKDLYISQVDDNQNTPPQNWVSITSIANDSLKKVANLSDLTNKTTARNNLGLGSSATLNKTDVLGTSTSLVATQKLVNDTKINLDSSKQDKLSFVGEGSRVMKAGAYGLGSGELKFRFKDSTSIFGGSSWNRFLGLEFDLENRYCAFAIEGGVDPESIKAFLLNKNFTAEIYTDKNTSTDSSGFLRDSGNKEAFTKDLVTQSTGSSTTSVMSQKAVTDAIGSHMLGYGQSWVDVSEMREFSVEYINNTDKPIFVSASNARDTSGAENTINAYIDGVRIATFDSSTSANPIYTFSFIVPAKSKYMVEPNNSRIKKRIWRELRG